MAPSSNAFSEADIDFLDIELPDAIHFRPAQWLDDRFDVVRGEGIVYEGQVRSGFKHGTGTLYDSSREQYISGEWCDDLLVNLYFAQFKSAEDDFFRLNGWDDLITSNKHNFVARITKKKFGIKCKHFTEIRVDIEKRITIVKILDDNLKNDLSRCRERLQKMLINKKNQVTSSRDVQQDMFQLFLLMNEIKDYYNYEDENKNIQVLRKLVNNDLFSKELRNNANETNKMEKTAFSRNKKLPIMKLSEVEFSWQKIMNECIEDSIIKIKVSLVKSLPTRGFISSGNEDINNLQNRQLFTCSVQDIQLFTDLEITSRQYFKSEIPITNFYDFTQEYVSKLWKLLITKINQTILNDISEKSIYTNSVFLQLFKTFLELLNVICSENKKKIENIVKIKKDCDLEILKFTNSNKNRLDFIINLMNHFKPGNVKNYNFNYKYKSLTVNQAWYKRVAGFIYNKIFDNSLTGISQENIIWLYYIHSSFSELFTQKNLEESDKKNELAYFLNSLMDIFRTVIKDQEVSLEKIRILASSVIKFGITISPYFLQQSSEELIELALQQAEYMKDFVTANENALDDITNIVDIYQIFWDERTNLFTELRNKYSNSLPITDTLIKQFNSFVKEVFSSKICTKEFLTFLRSFIEFVRLFRGTKFSWYVKGEDKFSKDFLELVDEENNSYLVNNTDGFLQTCKDNQPRHYLLEVAIQFMKCVRKFLNRDEWNENDKIQAASDLFLLMGRSLINFKKLPNAVDFNKFFSVFTDPFERITNNSSNINDFKRRLGSLENYYKYTIELNVMSAENALKLCRNNMNHNSVINYLFDSSILQECFNVYQEKFNTYVEFILQPDFSISKLVEKVKNIEEKDISDWDSNYKTVKLPNLLAGLSAVWSALESKDVISNNQKDVIKPHVIQILCILRLLGSDQSKNGIENHLGQVLTGQGKSIVLSLLAAALALTGNNVRIVCYNRYLANRDQNHFKNFYSTLKIYNQIKYFTFDDIANEILNTKIEGVTYGLREYVAKLVTDDLQRLYVTEKERKSLNTVLLIDEVDVFFTPKFYGSTYNPCETIGSEKLADLQIKIWNLTSSTCDESILKDNIQKYIDEEFPQATDNTFINIVKNCRNILNIHVARMISNAVSVRNNSISWLAPTYKLREDDGLIIYIKDSGEHVTSTYSAYYNVFMYFKLKKTNYEHKNFHNYGYLNINCGNVSYAILPKDYKHILGVTGTLTQLSNIEMEAVSSYGVSRGSDMPTFFGSNKLKIRNFTIKDSIDTWTTTILDRILDIVKNERAVIVFFIDEQTIDTIKNKFASHLSRYSVLTGNETEKEIGAVVEEAGMAKKVTIATRRMGRGVDFQSNDSAVEAKGGVHVIQTFFSEDIKEETQIKGRTARKDNSGSYETILCRQHLKKAGYEDTASSYEELCKIRAEKTQEKGKEIAENIKKSKEKHDATMKFLKSFYNYDPKNRYEYFQKYPFVDIN